MAKRKQQDELEEPIVDIGEVGEQAKDFFEQYQRIILGVAGGLALIFIIYFAYRNFYQQPREQEAITQIYKAQQSFEQDSFNKALLDPGGGYLGFIDIADQYSGTKAGNLANYYAGASFLHLGNYDKAIRYLGKFSAKDAIAKARKLGMLGDAYSELQKFDKAVSYYKDAASATSNALTTPEYLKKAGMLYEHQQKYKDALKQYQKIRDEYYDSNIGKDIEKYIARVEGK